MAKLPTFVKSKSDIQLLRENHEQEIVALRRTCDHKKYGATWCEEWWAPGHGTGSSVKVCDNCGQEMDRRKPKWQYELKKKGRKKGVSK